MPRAILLLNCSVNRPGIVVDNNDNITMLGRSGVQIYIDGKLSPLEFS